MQLEIFRIAAIAVLVSTIGYGCATPASSSARQGFVLFYRGECKQAATSFEHALKSDPDSAEAYYGQGLANACTGQYDAAIADYSSAIRLDPRWRAYRNRAEAYEQKGGYIHALADFNAAIALRPDDSLLYLQRAHLYARSGQGQAAKADQDQATRFEGKLPSASYFNEYAWILATAPAEQARNGPMALEYAAHAAGMSVWQSPRILDTLAAAYAENGQFDQAIRWQNKACKLQQANQPGWTLELQEMNARLALYEKRQPYREEPIAAPAYQPP